MIAKTAGRMTELFASWDKDCNGFVDKKEFRAACNALGVTYPNSIIDAVFDVFDEDRTGQLDHHELVRVARRAAFERGFIPKRESAPPTVLRKLDMYWARRNRLHMEAHEHEVSRLREAEENARQRSLDERRDERRSVLHSKRERAREQAIGRKEKYWVRRDLEKQREQRFHQAVEEPIDEPIRFLPQIPAVARAARATWAKDPCCTTRLRSPDRAEVIREVAELRDVWVGTYVAAWKAPTAEQKVQPPTGRRLTLTHCPAP